MFIGDIVGQSGRSIVFNLLDRIKKEYNIDFVIANGENSAHGKGITTKIYNQLLACGVNCITLGNHAFSKLEILNNIDNLDCLVRPINLDREKDRGKGYRYFDVNGLRIGVINVMGNVFMYGVSVSPFEAIRKLLYEDKIKQRDKLDIIFVDIHAEATSEKIIFANYFKNQINVVVGTHTHIQTADERMIENTAYISDVGMCGAYNSIIGRDIDESIEAFVYKNKTHYTVAEGDAIFSAVVIEIDDLTKKTKNIKRIQIRP